MELRRLLPIHAGRKFAVELLSGSPFEPAARALYRVISGTGSAKADRETSEILRGKLCRASNCIDVGCYRGEILGEFMKLSPDGVHFAFEPIPDNYEYLVKRYPKAKVYCLAIGAERGMRSFVHVLGRPARSGLQPVPYPDPNQKVAAISVPSETLDSVIPTEQAIHLLKVDVEGGELNVFKGASKLLARCKPTLIFELHPHYIRAYGISLQEIFEFLTGFGYSMRTLTGSLAGEAPLTLAEFVSSCAVPREHYIIAEAET